MVVEVTQVEGAELAGYLAASSNEAGFVIPVFRRRESNRMLVQKVGSDDRVIGFHEIGGSATIHRAQSRDLKTDVDQQALWAFLEEGGELHIAPRDELSAVLKRLIDGQQDPFLQLQIAQFCEMEDEIALRLRAAFAHMGSVAPGSANAWRDVVIVPAGVRAAVYRALVHHGISEATGRLGADVRTDLEHGRLVVELAAPLHKAFKANRAALETFWQGTAALRSAFDLGADVETRLRAGPETEAPPAGSTEVVAIAVGDLASRVLHQLARAHGGSPYGAQIADAEPVSGLQYFEAKAGQSGVHLQLRGEPDPTEVAGDATIFVVLQMKPNGLALVADAIASASRFRANARRVVAVVPHLPRSELTEAQAETWRQLEDGFDAVWVLSDRSPYTRQSLAYGPGRSVPAAARRLGELISLASSPDFPLVALPSQKMPDARISVLASASGDAHSSTLAHHALMKLLEPTIDFESSNTAIAFLDRAGSGVDELSLKHSIERFIRGASVTVVHRSAEGIAPAELNLASIGALIMPMNAVDFASYCQRQLENFGWTGDSSSSGAKLIVDIHQQPTIVDFAVGRDLGRVLAIRPFDLAGQRVCLTDSTVSRRDFLLGVLRGITPVHVSRIPVLDKILQRRWSYALTTLRRAEKTQEDLVVSTALEALAAELRQPQAELLRTKLDHQVTIHSDEVSVRIKLGEPMQPFTLVDIRINRGGWSFPSII